MSSSVGSALSESVYDAIAHATLVTFDVSGRTYWPRSRGGSGGSQQSNRINREFERMSDNDRRRFELRVLLFHHTCVHFNIYKLKGSVDIK